MSFRWGISAKFWGAVFSLDFWGINITKKNYGILWVFDY
jgi:hypothetical protein